MGNFIKQIWEDMNIHNKAILSYLAFAAGVALAFTALFLPPIGEIAISVISVISELFILSGAFVGIDLAFDQKLMHFESKVKKDLLQETKNEHQR